MEELIYVHKTFEKLIQIEKTINHREFDGCVFQNCDFSSSDFSMNTFIDCEFSNCNLSLINLKSSSLKGVVFKNCKLLGIEFNHCDDFLFEVIFYDCTIDFASFASKKMTKTLFSNCSLKEVSFLNANLFQSKFDKCNLEGALFNDTDLREVNFSTSYNFSIDPEFNKIKKARFASEAIAGLLTKYDIKIV